MKDPDMGHWTYRYDEAGNLEYQEDNLGQAVNFQYDALGRLILKDYSSPADVDVQYFYDDYDGVPDGNSKGKLTRVMDGSGQTEFYYNSLGRVIKNVKTIDCINYTTETAKDLIGRTESIEYPDDEVVS